MEFFDHQQRAYKKTRRLLFYFALGVMGIIGVTYFLAVAGLSYSDRQLGLETTLWHPELFAFIFTSTALIVAGGSLFKIAQLSKGGSVVAESLGGQRISTETKDPEERKVLNVVEEMAIASGIPVPPVFILRQEEGINAFAAGYNPDDAVIGITKGAVEQFTRDELQGVIAHEFSHIFNGDMRLNIRLMGLVHGILVLGLIGYYLMRMAAFSSYDSRRGGGGILLVIGLGLVILGSIGTFFGNIIKAAISRQREYLADASAVQFTRNNEGLANALKRIAGFKGGSTILHPSAPEASHMFFSRAITSGFQSLFATHPPVRDRIRRIDAGWSPEEATQTSPSTLQAIAAGGVSAFSTDEGNIESEGVAPTQDHLSYAQKVLKSIPEELKDAAHEPFGARALVYALLLSPEPEVRHKQLMRLVKYADTGVYKETENLISLVSQVSAEARLPLIDLAIPTLRTLTLGQYKAFRRNTHSLVEADTRIDLFEWTLERILVRHLDPQFIKMREPGVAYRDFNQVQEEVEILIASLAYIGASDLEEAKDAFHYSVKKLGFSPTKMPPPESLRFNLLNQVVNKLEQLSKGKKQELLQACEACVCVDFKISKEEGELLRAVADAIGSPIPPLLPGQPVQHM